MKNYIINNCLKIVKRNKQVSKEQLEIIEYGLVGIYLAISKTIVITLIAALLGYLYESIMFTIIYGLLRTFSYGIHAKKSWMCWISSLTIFILIPIIAKNIFINYIFKIIIGFVGSILILKNSPADTYKRPIISKRKRLKLKTISFLISLTYFILSIVLYNQFLCNCFIYSIALQNILISKYTYKLFNLPYNNYISYLKRHPELNNL